MHAFLIVGKDKEARSFSAQKILAERKIWEVHTLETANKHTIAEARNLKSRLSFAPQDSKKGRAVLIKEAQLFTLEAANAFLKTLEEPVGATIFILTAPNPDQVVQTICSRCQLVDLGIDTSKANNNQLEVLDQLLSLPPSVRLEYLDKIGNRPEALEFCHGQLLAAREKLRASPSLHLLSLVEHLDQARLDLEANVNVKVALADLLLNYPESI